MYKMYEELAEWWPLLSPPEDYAEEAAVYRDLLTGRTPVPKTVLELGSGGGNNASHMKQWFDLTLTDLSEGMLAESRKLNPECVHLQGDMRTVRLETTFDAVFVHDAVCYMTTETDLRAVMETASIHCRTDGVVLFAPDWIKERFAPGTDDGGGEAPDGRALKYFEWVYDFDPTDSVYNVEYVMLVRDANNEVVAFHDRHVEGLFSEATWLSLLSDAGFEAEAIADPVEADRVLFLGRKV